MAKSSLELTLYSGSKFNFEVDSRVAQAVAKHHETGGVFFAIEGGEVFSVNLENVVAVHGAPSQAEPEAPGAMIITNTLATAGKEILEKKRESRHQVSQDNEDFKSLDENKDKALFKIECKCGVDYFCILFADARRCRCKICGDTLYVDKFASRIGDNSRPAMLATNRYRVPFINDNEIA